MSVEQIEQEIRRLPEADLLRLARWFNGFLATQNSAPRPPGPDWHETPELIAELNRRLAEFHANPAVAIPFEPDYFDTLKRQIEDERTGKPPAR